MAQNLRLLVVDTPDFNSKDGFAFVWKLSSPFLKKAAVTLDLKSGKYFALYSEHQNIHNPIHTKAI